MDVLQNILKFDNFKTMEKKIMGKSPDLVLLLLKEL